MLKDSNLIWLDLEMTGLGPDRHCIIEIATVITDANLEILAEGPVLAIHQSEEELAKMDAWNVKTHTESGLIARVRASTYTEKIAEDLTLQFIQQYVSAGKSPIAGNSICQDRRFLYRYMPNLEKYFHYRNLDVSTLKELALRWRPELPKALNKASRHMALEDIRESIEELRFYKEHFLKVATE